MQQEQQHTQKISRRTLAKGAAWATPVVAASAMVPAYAASKECAPADFITGTYANGSFNSANYTNSMSATFGPASGITATITTERTDPSFGLVYNSSTLKGFYNATGQRVYPLFTSGTQDTNLALTSTAKSKCGYSNSIMLSQESRNGHGQTVTFTFNQPVSSVQFQIIDPDQINGNYADNIVVDSLNRGTVNFSLGNPADSSRISISNNDSSAASANAISPSNYSGATDDCMHRMNVSICANDASGFTSFTLKYTSSVDNAVWTNRKVQINQMITVSPLQITPATCMPSSCKK